MKQCPNCQTTYTDDTLKFCLQDGTPLVSSRTTFETETPAAAFTDSETLVSPRRVEPLQIPIEDVQTRDWEQSRQTKISAVQPEPKKSNTFKVAALTAVVMLLLFGGIIGVWFYLKRNKIDVVQNTNNKAQVNQNSLPKNNVSAEVSPSPTVVTKSPSPTATPTGTPTAAPTAAPSPGFNSEQVKREVSEKINAWKTAAESVNSTAYMNYYADTIDYYNKKKAGLDFVRRDKQKFFDKYNDIKINISNLRVTTDAAGENSTAVFDKEWKFESEDNYSAGKVQSQLQLRKFDGRWLITGEKDLKVYYTE